MTRTNGDTVKLSVGNWIALVGVLLIPAGAGIAYLRSNDAVVAEVKEEFLERQAKAEAKILENQIRIAVMQDQLSREVARLSTQLQERDKSLSAQLDRLDKRISELNP